MQDKYAFGYLLVCSHYFVDCANKNNKKVLIMKQENKNNSVTFRLTDQEKEVAQGKAEGAGYKTISAFIRDYLINETPKDKISVSPKSFELLSAISIMSSKLNSGANRQELSEEIAKITRLALGQ